MSDLLSKLYNDYDEYKLLCLKYKVPVFDMVDKEWLEHYWELLKLNKNE